MLRFKNGLAKDAKTGTWLYCFKINQQVFKGSTRARDRMTAGKILDEKRKEAILEQKGLQSRIPTVTELVALWFSAHQSIHSRSHLVSVEGALRLWVCPKLGNVRIDRVTTLMVENARQGMLDAGRSPVSANLMIRSVRLLWRWAVRIGYIDAVPFLVHQMKVQRKPRPVVPVARVKEFFEVVDGITTNPQVKVMMRVMVGLGLRRTEALGMRWEWFSAEQRTYTVGKAKGKDARIIPVPAWLWESIHAMPKTLSEWVFPSTKDGKPHRHNFLTKPLKEAAAKLKLGRLTQHRLRATFASLHAQSGCPITEIQGMLGHRNLATTMIYVETSLEAKRAAQDALSQKLGLA
jgi:integrase